MGSGNGLEPMVENERRLRTVEDAVIKMEQILEVVVVDLKDRVRVLEKNDATVQKQMHESCDLKSTEIDKKCNAVKNDCNSFIKDSRTLFFKIVGSTIGLGLLFIMYSTTHISTLEANQKVLIEKIDQINEKLDKANGHRYYLQKELKEAK